MKLVRVDVELVRVDVELVRVDVCVSVCVYARVCREGRG